MHVEAAECRNCETTTPEFDIFTQINIRVWQFSVKPYKCVRCWFFSFSFLKLHRTVAIFTKSTLTAEKTAAVAGKHLGP